MRLENKQRKPAVRVLAAALAVALFGGLIAASANDTIQPRLVGGSAFPNNSPASVPSEVERAFSRVAMSGDASVKFTTSGTGGQIMYYNAGGQVENTSLQPTAECPASGGTIGIPAVSYNGQAVSFQSDSPHIACLFGQESNLGGTITWAGIRDNAGWTFRALQRETGLVRFAAPAISGDGGEVYFVSQGDLTQEKVGKIAHVYRYDLNNDVIDRVSLNEKTGAGNGISISPNSRIIISEDGKYVGWDNPMANYTGRMLSDEAGNSISNITIAKVKDDQGNSLPAKDVRMMAVPSPTSEGEQKDRSGKLLALVSGSGETSPKAIYAFSKTSNGYAYDLQTGAFYDLGILLSDASVDGKGGVYSKANITEVLTYNLGSDPGVTPIRQTEFSKKSVSTSSAGSTTVFLSFTTKDRAVLSLDYKDVRGNASWTTEYPLP